MKKQVKKTILLILFCCCGGVAQAQEKGVQSPSIAAAWAPVKVDHHIGIRGGYAMGTARFEPIRNTDMLMGLMLGGLTYKFDVPKQKYVGMIEVDLTWTQKGYTRFQNFDPEAGVEQEQRTCEIELPILWQPYLPLGRGGSRFYLSAGPYVSYALSSEIRGNYDPKDKGNIPPWQKYDYDPTKDNRWGYGIAVGGGFMIAIKRFAISVEGRYNIGLSDILKGVEKVPDNNYFRSPMDQIAISFGVGYRFRQDGTRALREEL